jgi:hypothetical protein
MFRVKGKLAAMLVIASIVQWVMAVSPDYLHLDNSLNLVSGVGFDDPYYNGVIGIEGSLLSEHLWLGLNANGFGNLQVLSAATPERIATGFNFNLKVGTPLAALSLNWIPYAGIGYQDVTNVLHQDSIALFNYNLKSDQFMLGVKNEYALSSRQKLSLDSTFIYALQDQILPNQPSGLSHNELTNSVLQFTPAWQFALTAAFSLEVYATIPVLLSHNYATLHCTACYPDAQAIIAQLTNPDYSAGLKLGWLF